MSKFFCAQTASLIFELIEVKAGFSIRYDFFYFLFIKPTKTGFNFHYIFLKYCKDPLHPDASTLRRRVHCSKRGVFARKSRNCRCERTCRPSARQASGSFDPAARQSMIAAQRAFTAVKTEELFESRSGGMAARAAGE